MVVDGVAPEPRERWKASANRHPTAGAFLSCCPARRLS